MGRIQIRVLGARSLADSRLIGTPDPYIIVKIDAQSKHTAVCQKQVNPQWNESFDFDVLDINNTLVTFEMWNKNPAKDDFMGMFTLPISRLVRGIATEDWCQLKNGEFVTGELQIVLLALDFGLEPPMVQQRNLVAAGPRANLLQVRILGARSIADAKLMGTPDPYVAIKLEKLTCRTAVCQKQINPEWNETFDLAIVDFSSAEVTFEMWNKNPVKDDFMGSFTLPLIQLGYASPVEDWCQLRNGDFITGELHLQLLATSVGGMMLPPVAAPRQVVAQEVIQPTIVKEQVVVREEVDVINAVPVPCVEVPATSMSRGYFKPLNPALPNMPNTAPAVFTAPGAAPVVSLPSSSAPRAIQTIPTRIPIR